MNAFLELRDKILEAIAPRTGDFDYSFVEAQRGFWEQLAAATGGSVVLIDIYSNRPLYVSDTLFTPLGVNISALKENIAHAVDYIHPADFKALAEWKFNNFLFLLNRPVEQKLDYKYIYQYRIRVGEDKYIWVIEQQQAVRLDSSGNARIMLSLIDVSPNQFPDNRANNEIFNYKTGEIVMPDRADIEIATAISLTEREKEILKMIQAGLLSKEISEQLSISFNTVNTHRQNILRKLSANNSLEAVGSAKELGLI